MPSVVGAPFAVERWFVVTGSSVSLLLGCLAGCLEVRLGESPYKFSIEKVLVRKIFGSQSVKCESGKSLR